MTAVAPGAQTARRVKIVIIASTAIVEVPVAFVQRSIKVQDRPLQNLNHPTEPTEPTVVVKPRQKAERNAQGLHQSQMVTAGNISRHNN